MQTELTQPSPSQTIDPAARREIIVGVLLAIFLAALDQTIVVVPRNPRSVAHFGGSQHDPNQPPKRATKIFA
jgi:hypothetical protein